MNIFPVQKSSPYMQTLRKTRALRSQPGTRMKNNLLLAQMAVLPS